MKFINIFVLLLFFPILAPAQGPDIRYKGVYEVFNKIAHEVEKTHKGMGWTTPQLIIVPQHEFAAQTDGAKRVELSAATYDICREFGPDSLNTLAFILSHELVHCIDDRKIADFAQGFATVRAEDILSTAFEGKADERGAFYAFLAGYDCFKSCGPLFDTLYKRFDIHDVPNYPSRQARKDSLIDHLENAKALAAVFRAGIYSAASDNFVISAACFNFLARYYPSPEMYSNAAAALLADRRALLFEKPGAKVSEKYCIIWDDQSLLTRALIDTNAYGAKKGLRLALSDSQIYEKAQDLLNQAFAFDKNYIPAYVNQACMKLLQGRNASESLENAERFAKMARDEHMLPIIRLMEGIGVAKNATLQVEKRSPVSEEKPQNEEIEGISVKTMAGLKPNMIEVLVEDNDTIFPTLHVHMDIKPTYEVLVIDAEKAGIFHFVSATKNYAKLNTHNIKIGTTLSELTHRYTGMPSSFLTKQGIYLRYGENVIFHLEKSGDVYRVVGWTVVG